MLRPDQKIVIICLIFSEDYRKDDELHSRERRVKERLMPDQKTMNIKLPSQGFVYWPVGSGDSTTIAIDDKTTIQVDLRHLNAADDNDDPRMAIIDHLVKILPKINGKPYLSAFILTHPDEDHCRGFADLLKQVTIGELWHTPRVFREYPRDLCDDAKVFRAEAKRRAAKTIKEKGNVGAGDRVRVIGYDDLLKEDTYRGLPASCLTIPGGSVTQVDGKDLKGKFSAFIHGPFKDDCDGERNDTSVAMQVSLISDKAVGRALFLGDLCYPTIKKIFDISKPDTVEWNILLAPHHCSKSAMYWQAEGEKEESLKQDILYLIEGAGRLPGYIVASSEPVPLLNKSGDNPPHAKAKARYQEIAPNRFLCTQEHPNEKTPEPIIFSMTGRGLKYEEPKQRQDGAKSQSISAAVSAARGGNEPPRDRVGFGLWQ
jgi:beta-lactamase superfamily II metal-dependent hydrolase